jgi:hypothetical protein
MRGLISALTLSFGGMPPSFQHHRDGQGAVKLAAFFAVRVTSRAARRTVFRNYDGE